MTTFHVLLQQALALNASDLFITATKPPYFRVKGQVTPVEDPTPIMEEEVSAFRLAVIGEKNEALYQRKGTYDISFMLSKTERFRLNFFATLQGSAFVARPLHMGGQLHAEALHLPPVLLELCNNDRGLILVVGSTGSGKSTTLATMVNHINRTASKHILTLEDPIEFVHTDIQSLISQREINLHAENFVDALRSGLRENPDVILIGELRDTETMQVAVSAALTGHLVIATVHTSNAIQTIERIISMFPSDLRNQVATDLSLALLGVVAQRLLPSAKTAGMVPAVEVLLTSSTVRKHIEDRNYLMLDDLLRQVSVPGMQTFCRELFRLYQAGEITLADARRAADNVDEFDLLVRGMEAGADTFRQHYGDKTGQDDTDTLDMIDLLSLAAHQRASDLLLTVGKPPTVRINGEWCAVDLPPLCDSDVRRLVLSIINQRQRTALEENRELDFSLSFLLAGPSGEKKSSRFRVNIFYQRGSLGTVLRIVNTDIPKPERLGIPPRVIELTQKKQGLIIVVGPTGSGKSTTLASLIDAINHTRPAHIITIEDPVEFTYTNDQSIIEQREVHSDTLSFSTALKHAMRQAPDIIMVGEMRDTATMAAALTASETGHLVLATLHTNTAPQTIDRIIDSFSAEHQNQIRQQLASALIGIVSQRLLPRQDGKGRIAAFEVMIATPPVCALIRDNKTFQLQSIIETSQKDGMLTLEYYMNALAQRGLIAQEEIGKYLTEAKRFG
jgi:twitching motility protein PilT